MENIFLNLNEIPQFELLKAEEIESGLMQLIEQANKQIEAIKQLPDVNWQNTVARLTDAVEKVSRAWGVVAHINSVNDTAKWREQYNKLIPLVTEFYTAISQDSRLFELFKQIRNSDEYERLSVAQQKRINNDLRDFKLSGVNLPVNERAKFAQLNAELATLSSKFSQNVLDSTDSFGLYFEDTLELSGIAENDLALFQAAAAQEKRSGFKIGLQIPFYLAVMKYADNRALREKIYRAYLTRASELFESGKWDNTAIINRILAIAAEQAQLIGFETAADLSLETKMAAGPQKVIDFLLDIVNKAKPFAIKEMQELQQFAAEQLQLDQLAPWDIAYVSEKLRETKYVFSEEEIKHYFPVSKVLQGLFKLINELYGIEFEMETRPTWHPQVLYYNLKKDQQIIGGVYIDLFARMGKKGGAWMNEYCGRRLNQQKLQLPIAYLVCNFTPPIESTGESYLTHQEVLTLFHEMGHGLHHLLTEVDELNVSGINGVEWDAVELPSQFMENFVWEYDVLKAMSSHRESKQSLPKELFDKMVAAKNFQVGLFLLRQMEFGLFDMQIYSQLKQPCDWNTILTQIRKEVSVIPSLIYNRFANSFEHIFAGGYSAGYYSYIWAEVLSADVYQAFIESGNRQQTGQKFLQEFLSQGGSRPALESFKAFRGREPEVSSLLNHLGLNV